MLSSGIARKFDIVCDLRTTGYGGKFEANEKFQRRRDSRKVTE